MRTEELTSMYDDWEDDDIWDDEDDYKHRYDDDEWGCEFGEHCLMPSYDHMKSECYTVEMAEAWREEMEQATV